MTEERNDLVDVGELDRKDYLGGSDLAALMGVSPYKTPLDVYLQKIGHPVDPPTPQQLRQWRRGKLMEPVVVQMMCEDFDIEVAHRNHRYRDPEHAYMAAEIDLEWRRKAVPALSNGEVKTVHPFKTPELLKWGEPGTGEVPVFHAAQSMWGLMITGRQLCQYGVLFGSDDLQPYHIERDDDTIIAMRGVAMVFWQEHVLARKAPMPRTDADLKKLWPKKLRNELQVGPEVAELVEEHYKLGRGIKECEDRREEIARGLATLIIGDDFEPRAKDAALKVTLMRGPKALATYAARKRTGIDADALRAEQPAIAEQYSKTTYYRELRHSTKKDA